MPGRRREEASESGSVEELENLKARLDSVVASNAEMQRELDIAHEEMQKAGAVNAGIQTKLRTWPGVDWSRPAVFVKLFIQGEDGNETPAQGKQGYRERRKDGTVVDRFLTFVDGYTVTNNIDDARMIVMNLKQHYAIGSVSQ